MTTPIILCGKTSAIATGVIANLRPEYEGTCGTIRDMLLITVIHLILSLDQGKHELPILLQGKEVSSSNEEAAALGTHDYSEKAAAILLGAGYDDDAVKEMRAACGDYLSIPWLRPDNSKPAPPLGPEYGKALVARAKETLAELKSNGEINQDGIHYY